MRRILIIILLICFIILVGLVIDATYYLNWNVMQMTFNIVPQTAKAPGTSSLVASYRGIKTYINYGLVGLVVGLAIVIIIIMAVAIRSIAQRGGGFPW